MPVQEQKLVTMMISIVIINITMKITKEEIIKIRLNITISQLINKTDGKLQMPKFKMIGIGEDVLIDIAETIGGGAIIDVLGQDLKLL